MKKSIKINEIINYKVIFGLIIQYIMCLLWREYKYNIIFITDLIYYERETRDVVGMD